MLLTVDRAQDLARRVVEELRVVCNCQVRGTTLLRSFVAGQSEWRRILQSSDMQQCRQRLIA